MRRLKKCQQTREPNAVGNTYRSSGIEPVISLVPADFGTPLARLKTIDCRLTLNYSIHLGSS